MCGAASLKSVEFYSITSEILEELASEFDGKGHSRTPKEEGIWDV
jgi:hypothetical protein